MIYKYLLCQPSRVCFITFYKAFQLGCLYTDGLISCLKYALAVSSLGGCVSVWNVTTVSSRSKANTEENANISVKTLSLHELYRVRMHQTVSSWRAHCKIWVNIQTFEFKGNKRPFTQYLKLHRYNEGFEFWLQCIRVKRAWSLHESTCGMIQPVFLPYTAVAHSHTAVFATASSQLSILHNFLQNSITRAAGDRTATASPTTGSGASSLVLPMC